MDCATSRSAFYTGLVTHHTPKKAFLEVVYQDWLAMSTETQNNNVLNELDFFNVKSGK
jgi:hypothetical protein